MKTNTMTILTAGLVLALSATTLGAKEAQPGDQRKGEGKGHPVRLAKGELQPGDDRGGKKGEPQPGDDRRGKGHPVRLAKGEPQPGDDRGGTGHPVRFA